MHLTFDNVNDAFAGLVQSIQNKTAPIRRTNSRNGGVIQIDEPMIITYNHPLRRVLFNSARDANPFFHAYESLWMLAGRNDVAPLKFYTSKMGDFSDDDKTLNGAYGYRWRHAERYEYTDPDSLYRSENVDQLDVLVNHLKADPNSRRAVLQMWNVEDDLLKIGYTISRESFDKAMVDMGNRRDEFTNKQWEERYTDWINDHNPASRDVCCNLSVMFSIRHVADHNGSQDDTDTDYLDMTVTNRSNDMIWGMLGANYCHFSFLQEYMAARIGVEVGKYHHFSNNLHVYDWNWKPEEWLNDKTRDIYQQPGLEPNAPNMVPLVKNPVAFEKELHEVVNWYDGSRSVDELINKGPREYEWNEPFLEEVAGRMFAAFALYKAKDFHGALAVLGDCPADDWRMASENWIKRRIK